MDFNLNLDPNFIFFRYRYFFRYILLRLFCCKAGSSDPKHGGEEIPWFLQSAAGLLQGQILPAVPKLTPRGRRFLRQGISRSKNIKVLIFVCGLPVLRILKLNFCRIPIRNDLTTCFTIWIRVSSTDPDQPETKKGAKNLTFLTFKL